MLTISIAPKSTTDKILETLEKLIDTVLPVIAPELGLSDEDVLQIEVTFHSFVGHVEAYESGTISSLDFILYLEIDTLNMAEVFSDDITFPGKCFTVLLPGVDVSNFLKIH